MKHIQHFEGLIQARSWKPALVLLLLVFSMQLWGKSESGWEMDLGMRFHKEIDTAINTNLKYQTTSIIGDLTLGWELNIPAYFVSFKDEEFFSTGFMTGPRAGMLISPLELMMIGDIGYLGVFPYADNSDAKYKITASFEYLIKYWIKRDYAVYLDFKKTYGITHKRFSTVGLGISRLLDY